MARYISLTDGARLLRDAGVTGESAVKLLAAGPVESGGGRDSSGTPRINMEARGDLTLMTAKWGESYGGWQVRTLKPGRAELAAEPFRDLTWLKRSDANQAKAVKDILDRQGLNAWTVIRENLHAPYTAEAREALATIGNTGVSGSTAPERQEVGPTGPPPTGSLVIGGRVIQPSELRVSGETLFADLDAVVVRLERDIDEADRLIVDVSDPKRELLEHQLLNEKSTVTLDGVVFELTNTSKRGSLLTVTFTDAAAVDLNRPVEDELTQAEGTATRGEFMRRIVDLVDWVKADIEPGLTLLEPLALGTPSFPEETPWQCLGRLAGEVQWRRCAVGNRVLIGSDEWLAGRAEPIPVHPQANGVDDIDFESDFGVPADRATIYCNAGLWSAPPSTAVELSGMGFANGQWLVSRFSRDDTTREAAIVELTRIRPALDEPSPPPEIADETPVDNDLGEGYSFPSTAGNVVQGPVSARGFQWPLSGTISSGFGPRPSPGGIGSTNHAGVDIRASVGTQVRAAAAGEVEWVGLRGGYGLLVIVKHYMSLEGSLAGGSPLISGRPLRTYYAHLNSAQVRQGQPVDRGAQIALSGGAPGNPNSGTSTGPHLHFEVRVQDGPVDPRPFLP